MPILDIIALIVFILPGVIGVFRRKKYGLLYALVTIVTTSVLIAGANFLCIVIFDRGSTQGTNPNPVIVEYIEYVTKYHKMIIDDIVVPVIEPIFGNFAEEFLYIATLIVDALLLVITKVFYKKKKAKKED